jgi:hypothetical protein
MTESALETTSIVHSYEPGIALRTKIQIEFAYSVIFEAFGSPY